MKLTGKILICLAGGFALNATALADDAALPGNPYAPVVVRNIFGLNPPPPPGSETPVDATPPPKITPNGIMTILGELQVLFKVANPAGPGKPAGDSDYILSEGQRQDDIEVVKIDEKGGVVTFNNHGTVQELPLVATSSGPATGGNPTTSFPTTPGGGRGFGNNFSGRGGEGFGGRNRGYGNSGGNNSGGMNNSPSFGNVPTSNNTYVDHPGVDLATQSVLIEANRMVAQQQGDPSAAIMPITAITPPESGGSDESPSPQ
jgi:hypothetical protein